MRCSFVLMAQLWEEKSGIVLSTCSIYAFNVLVELVDEWSNLAQLYFFLPARLKLCMLSLSLHVFVCLSHHQYSLINEVTRHRTNTSNTAETS